MPDELLLIMQMYAPSEITPTLKRASSNPSQLSGFQKVPTSRCRALVEVKCFVLLRYMFALRRIMRDALPLAGPPYSRVVPSRPKTLGNQMICILLMKNKGLLPDATINRSTESPYNSRLFGLRVAAYLIPYPSIFCILSS